jgi:SAM-dependent methyltransferase
MTIKMIGLTSRARIQHILENLPPCKGLILDAGCGAGEFLVSLQLRSIHAIGLDRDIHQLEMLNGEMRRMGERCQLVAADLSNLPFRDSLFQAIYCMEVINMLEKDENALMEFARVLDHDGTCTLSVPYESYPAIYDPLNRFLEKRGLGHRQIGIWSPGVKRLYRPSELLPKLRRLGLNPVGLTFIGKWLIPTLENYLSLLLYYKVLASKFKTRFAFKTHQAGSVIFNTISKLLDYIIKLDKMPNLYGTHFIIEAKKS